MDAHLKAPEPAHLEVPVCLYSQSARSSTVFTDAVSILSIEKAEKEETPVSEEDLYPDGGKEAYIVLFATFVCNFLGLGPIFASGVFINYYTSNRLLSVTQAACLGSLLSLGALYLPLVSVMVSRFGPARVATLGLMIAVTGNIASSFVLAKHSVLLLATYSIPCTTGMWLNLIAASLPSQWFSKRRGLALGIANASGGLGSAVFSVMTGKLLSAYGPAWTFRVLGLFMLCLGLPATLCLRFNGNLLEFQAKQQIQKRTANLTSKGKFRSRLESVLPATLMSSVTFRCILVSSAVLAFAIDTPAFFMPLSADAIGLSASTGANLLLAYNLCTAISRPVSGLLIDFRCNALHVAAVCMFALGIVCTAVWPLAGSVRGLAFFSIASGIFIGPIYNLLSSAISFRFGSQNAMAGMALVEMVSALGYCFGPAIAGLLQGRYQIHGGIMQMKNPAYFTGGLSLLSAVTLLIIPLHKHYKQGRFLRQNLTQPNAQNHSQSRHTNQNMTPA